MAGKNNENNKMYTKNWLTTLLLCWFLGFLGIHRMYVGKISSGAMLLYWTIVATLVTNLNVYLGLTCFIGIGAVVVNDFVLISMKKFKDCYGREVVEDKLK